jgi:pimeloyl-ACP methyl ester carboxylesterase
MAPGADAKIEVLVTSIPGNPLNMIKLVLGRVLLLPALALLLLGCEHSLQIQGQGDILSGSGARNCSVEQQPCSNSIVADYIETYTAKPRSGWRFDGWQGCDSTDERCEFNVPASTVQQFWGQTMVLVAKFEPLSTVRVDSGTDQTVTEGTEVVLQGAVTNSGDTALSYEWSQTNGQPTALKNAQSLRPSFVAPEVSTSQQLQFQLSVSGEAVAQATDTVAVRVNPETSGSGDGAVTWSKEISSLGKHRIWEVRYRSRTNLGAATTVSGWIAKPDPRKHRRPPGGYPVLAFAHGTTGLADSCAPTRRSNPSETIPLLREFLDKGFVVAATDYQGLGTEGLHHYLVGPTEGRSVLDSVRAARDFAQGGADAVLFGHSQGGHAVIFANELAASYAPELNIVGTIGSGTGVVDSAGKMLQHIKTSPYKGYLVMVALAQNAAYGDKEVPLSRWFTPAGIQAAQAMNSICVDQLVSTYGSHNADYLFVEGAPLPTTSGRYDPLKDATPGLRVGASPILMIHGRNDPQIPSAALIPWVEETCARGQKIYLKWFDTGHRVPYEAPGVVEPVLTSWIQDRFAGRLAPSSCGSVPRP